MPSLLITAHERRLCSNQRREIVQHRIGKKKMMQLFAARHVPIIRQCAGETADRSMPSPEHTSFVELSSVLFPQLVTGSVFISLGTYLAHANR